MNENNFFLISGIVFLLVFVFHSARILFGLEVVFGGWVVPMWVSWITVVVAGYLSYNAFKFGGCLKR